MTEILASKRRRATEILARHDRVLIALSGGVDSAVLLALAVEAVGADRAIAATGVSPSIARTDLADARRVARAVGVRHVEAPTGEFDLPAYRANAGDRCYHCRTELFRVLDALAHEIGGATVAYGAIRGDSPATRPGMRAAAERGVLAPLLDADIDKEEVRALARDLGLAVQDKPAAACLASRLPIGTPVSPTALEQVETAEAALRSLGFVQVRVRHHGQIARIETPTDEHHRFNDPAVRRAACLALRRSGFRFVTVDLEGYREGGSSDPSEAG
jgi:uncharacterized protein